MKLNSPPLVEHHVHIWQASLLINAEVQQTFMDILSPAERDRAQRFYFAKHRIAFIAAHGFMRSVLSHYLAVPAAEVAFDLGEHNKPSIQAVDNSQHITFNLSHSHQLAALALTKHHEIGVDVEFMKDNIECEALATRFFSEQEQVQLAALPASLKRQGFFNSWSRKEAFIKAIGRGLSYPLDDFDVVLTPGKKPAILRIADQQGEESQWTLQTFTAEPCYAAAFATKQAVKKVQQFWFEPDAVLVAK